MKKIAKAFSLVFVMLALCVMPLLAGCSRTYTVDISITGGNQNGGWVIVSGSSSGESAYGKTAVDEGDNFSARIAPMDGYYISAISVNGDNYDKVYDIGGHTLFIENVQEDTNVVVTFAKYEYTVTLMASTFNQAHEFTGWAEYTGYTCKAFRGEFINLEEFGEGKTGDGAFYLYNSIGAKVYVNPNSDGIQVNSGNIVLYTEYTVAELDELIKPEYSITVSDATVYSAGQPAFGEIVWLNENSTSYVDAVGEHTFKEGTVFTINVKPFEGYRIQKILVDGQELNIDDPTVQSGRSITMNKNYTFEVYFEAIPAQD